MSPETQQLLGKLLAWSFFIIFVGTVIGGVAPVIRDIFEQRRKKKGEQPPPKDPNSPA